jgi:hypothetical protein
MGSNIQPIRLPCSNLISKKSDLDARSYELIFLRGILKTFLAIDHFEAFIIQLL